MSNDHHPDTVTHCVVIFPFLGLDSDKLFVKLIEQCGQSAQGVRPIIVYDRRSRRPEKARGTLAALGDSIEIVNDWGVDTCANWLTGFGHVLDSKLVGPEVNHRVVLLPGDLVQVERQIDLFDKLDQFIRYDEKPFLVGDFASENPLSAKELIDIYGIFPLVANWFPDAWSAIRALRIGKPRSEFLNVAVPQLRRLLERRAFPYEQTLNMLILQWDWCWRAANEDFRKADELWHKQVGSMYLGKLSDDPSERNYRGAIDQIERTERLLRLLWRDLQEWNPKQRPENFRKLAGRFDRLDEHSTRIRHAARIAIWAQMGS